MLFAEAMAQRLLAETNLLLLRGLRLALLFDGGLGSSQTSDRHAVGRAAHVGQADAVAEFHGVGVAAVFAADAELDAGDRKSVV